MDENTKLQLARITNAITRIEHKLLRIEVSVKQMKKDINDLTNPLIYLTLFCLSSYFVFKFYCPYI